MNTLLYFFHVTVSWKSLCIHSQRSCFSFFISFLAWIPLCIQVHVYIWALNVFSILSFLAAVSVCPSFVGGVSAGRFLEAGLLGPGCEQRVPGGYRWPVCPEPYFMPVWHMGSAPSELIIFADLRFWVSLNTLSVGKNFFCIFFCIFPVKCLFISFTNFSFFLGFLSLGLSVVYILGQVTLCCRYFSQFVSCLLSCKCFWPCGLFYFNCCASLSVVVFAPGFWSTCPEVKENLAPVFCYLLLSFIYLRLCSIWGLLQYVWCNLWI